MRKGNIHWLVSYPKSGNTWLRLMLTAYYAETEPSNFDINGLTLASDMSASSHIFSNLMFVDPGDLTDAEIAELQPRCYSAWSDSVETPVWVKIHDARTFNAKGIALVPCNAIRTVVYLVRNPLDVAVSYAFHAGEADIGRYVDKLCDSDASIGGAPDRNGRVGDPRQTRQQLLSWSEHVTSWLDADDIDPLVVRYEDMLEDPARQLLRVLKHCDPKADIESARLQKAVDATRFEALQAQEAEAGFYERGSKQTRFFRRGRSGDWHHHLSPVHVERIVRAHRTLMERFGYTPEQRLDL